MVPMGQSGTIREFRRGFQPALSLSGLPGFPIQDQELEDPNDPSSDIGGFQNSSAAKDGPRHHFPKPESYIDMSTTFLSPT